MIRANMAEPMWRQVPRALGWMLNYLFTGTLFRVYRASHQYGLALTTFQMMLVWWLALAGLGGWLIGWLAMRLSSGPLAFGVIVGVVAALDLLSGCCGRWPTSSSWCRSTAIGRICWNTRAASRPAGTAASRPARIALSRSREPTPPTRSSWSATAAAA